MDASDRRKRAGSEAADWFARLRAGTMERAEREQFVEWLNESHIHVAEMLRVEQIHGSLERFQRWERISTGPRTDSDNVIQLPPREEAPQTSQAPRPKPGYRFRLLAVAAAVLVAVVAVMLPRIRGQVIETERGERREVVLNDGSMVQVDPETRLRVKYSDTVRRVFLERGRALFHVARNPSRPFLVQADDTTVQAVGTAFGVEQRNQGVVVTVAEGKVAVFPASQATGAATTSDGNDTGAVNGPAVRAADTSARSSRYAGGGQGAKISDSAERAPDTLFLTANQQVTVQSGGWAAPVQKVDSQRSLAWAEGRLIFQNEELAQVIAEFNRYNRVQLRVTDPELAAKPVSGVFNAEEPEAFIAFLQSVAPVEIARDGDRSITIGSSPHR